MPAYYFKERFAILIENGTKTYTIRKKRKRPTAPGDLLYLYIRMMSKKCHLLKKTECTKVQPIKISEKRVCTFNPAILKETILSDMAITALAKSEGFESVDDFFDFFRKKYSLPCYDFEIIHWRP